MRIHHVALVVADVDASLAVYRDLLGFEVIVDVGLPDGPGERTYFTGARLDDIFKVPGSRSRMLLLRSQEGTLIELQQPSAPAVRRATREQAGYAVTGFTELAFAVDGIDAWFERVRAAGLETQTDYVWSYAGLGRSFLFHDPDGNLVQLNEDAPFVRSSSGHPTAR
jgi:catechol 2,3-dioxygenase-like lactoylglutathione lyase family enzyme